MRFKYKYEHLDCNLCKEMRSGACSHPLCPHIMGNLDDLLFDPDFNALIEDAECVPTLHKPTLLHLKRITLPHTEPQSSEPSPYNHGIKPECAGCPYPHVGFFCYGPDGSCMKTDFNAAMARSQKPCPV